MPITTPTAERLQSVLRAAGVDLSLWGTTSALTIRHLWAQLGAREALLLREPGGALRLELRSVEVELHFRGRVLVETHREVDGRTHPRFALLSGRVRAAEPWRDAVARAVRGALRLDAAQYTVHHDGDGDDADAGGGGTGRPPPAESREFPGLPCAHETLPRRGDGARAAGRARRRRAAAAAARDARRRSLHHRRRGGRRRRAGGAPRWAWYPPPEWAAVRRKTEAEEARRDEVAVLDASLPARLKPCADVRFDGVGEIEIVDDDLGTAASQKRVLGALYLGARTAFYHVIAGGFSRAKILHVQCVDDNGMWEDPTICKLSPSDLLRAEADAHATFARYIGESVPQRLGEPICIDEIGGMVLELVGACWRVPELAHAPAHLSNTLADVFKHDSDHAADRDDERGRDRPVFGEVRIVVDEVFLGQLHTVVVQSAHREPGESLAHHYGLPAKVGRLLGRSDVSLPPPTRAALEALDAALQSCGEYAGPPGYGGPWFSIVHGDLHGGNIMVDSRSYAWLIDYGEVEDAHVFKDPAKLESCILYIYTTLPIPPALLATAAPHELRWWLGVPEAVAAALAAAAAALAPGALTLEALPDLLKRVRGGGRGGRTRRRRRGAPPLRVRGRVRGGGAAGGGDGGAAAAVPRPLDPRVVLRAAAVCDVGASEAVLGARRAGARAAAHSYCRPHKAEGHAFDSHPFQYATALFYFALKMATQYREPNPYSRRLAVASLTRLASYLTEWLHGREVALPADAAAFAAGGARGAPRPYRLAYALGQRLCFVHDGLWREGVVLRPPSAERPTHTLRVYIGADTIERDADLDLHSHTPLPLYAYDAGHPLELLTRVGHWQESVVVSRRGGTNQFIVRSGPTGYTSWALLTPWNHRSLSCHRYVPLFAVHAYAAEHWGDGGAAGDAELDALVDGDEGADRLEKRGEEGIDLDESASIALDRGKLVEFVLNVRAAQRGRALPLWCPALVTAIHKRQFGSGGGGAHNKSAGLMGKSCDLAAGAYRFSAAWGTHRAPLRARLRRDADDADAAADAAANGADADGADADAPAAADDSGGGGGGESSETRPLALVRSDAVGADGAAAPSAAPPAVPPRARTPPVSPPRRAVTPATPGSGGSAVGARRAAAARAARAAATAATAAARVQWGPWAKATVAGDRLHLSGGPRDGVVWERNMTLQVEALPEYRYDEGTEVRLLRGGAWIRCPLDAPHKSLANVYSAVVGGAAEEAVELTSRNHAPLLDVTMDLASEYLKYGGWIRSTYSFVVDALSGERLDIMLQCVKLKVDGSGERSDAFEVVMREVCSRWRTRSRCS